MAGKSKILEVIGGGKADLLLAEKVRRALQANERVKYLLTLLQLAEAQALDPTPNPDDLSVERRRAGIDDAELDQVIPRSLRGPKDSLEIPAAARILRLAVDETQKMCEPLLVARRPEAPGLKDRLEAVGVSTAKLVDRAEGAGSGAGSVDDRAILSRDLVGRLTSADRGQGDSLHLVVMDAHKALNGLMADLSGRRESLGGADALGLTDDDRLRVEAFTAGVNSTRFLKGTHPGLDTTAVRVGTKLLIQNDVGETDAHVVVLEIGDGDGGDIGGGGDGAGAPRKLEITYTDVHDKRVEFFSALLEGVGIRWKKTESRYSAELTESAFVLVRGSLTGSPEVLDAALRAIGSSLVFLIDWNKARKRLRNFLRSEDVVETLLWAARERMGHMAFLSYGDEELIYEALEALPQGTIRRGEPFSAVLGRKGTLDFLKDTLRLAWESYERKEPRALLLDRLRCLLLARVQRKGRGADEILVELAGLAVEAALTFRDALRAVTRPSEGLIVRAHARISRWEERADEKLNRIRKMNLKEPQPLLPVAVFVDDALDALEDVADLAAIIQSRYEPAALPRDLVRLLEKGAEFTLQGAQGLFKIVHRYRELVRGGIAETLFDLINELKRTEAEADGLKREFRSKLLSGDWKAGSAGGDIWLALSLRELAAGIEDAVNAVSRAGFQIHDLAYAAMERVHG